MSRLRGGSARAARGAASFLTETISRVRHAGATGQLTVRADSAFYSTAMLATATTFDVRFSITARQDKRIRAAIDDAAWLARTVMAHNLDRAIGQIIGTELEKATVATLRRTIFTMPGRLVHTGRRRHRRLPASWPWADPVLLALSRIRPTTSTRPHADEVTTRPPMPATKPDSKINGGSGLTGPAGLQLLGHRGSL